MEPFEPESCQQEHPREGLLYLIWFDLLEARARQFLDAFEVDCLFGILEDLLLNSRHCQSFSSLEIELALLLAIFGLEHVM